MAPINPKSLENLRPGESPGRGTDYDEPKNKSVGLKVTATTKEILKGIDNPFKQAGYTGISEFIEMVCRGQVKLPDKPQ